MKQLLRSVRPLVSIVSALVVLAIAPSGAQLICEQDPTRIFSPGGECGDTATSGASLSGIPNCSPQDGPGCGGFDNDADGCNSAFALGTEGQASCWFDGDSGECRICSAFDASRLRCTNTCDPTICNDTDRTQVDSGDNGAATTSGQSQGGPGCGQFDGDATACAAAFVVIERRGIGVPYSCYYEDGACSACRPDGESTCTNECLPPPTCADSSRSFSGGPGEGDSGGACRQFGDEQSCLTGFARNGNGDDVSCYWSTEGVEPPATTNGASSEGGCRGCNRFAEAEGLCVNTCTATVCEQDPERSRAPAASTEGAPEGIRTSACTQFSGDPTQCEASFTEDQNGNAISCSAGFQCLPCGRFSGSPFAVGAVTSGVAGPPGCLNDCIETPPCLDDSLSFVGGPGTQACQQLSGDRTACEASYALSGDLVPLSCWYDEDSGECAGCNPRNTALVECTNKCQPNPSCDDGTRTLYAGGKNPIGGDGACGLYDNDETNCNLAYARRRQQPSAIVSCFYDSAEDRCRGCAPSREGSGQCVNSCDPATCADSVRSLTSSCGAFNGQQGACESVFVRENEFGFTSCWYNDGLDRCEDCSASDVLAGDCTNQCQAPPPCPEDDTRTLFTGDARSQACRAFDGDPTNCALAYARNNEGESVSCFYDQDEERCRGCSYGNQVDRGCSNTCSPPPSCANTDRTVLSSCFSITDVEACGQAFTLDGNLPVACVAWPDCRACTLFEQAAGTCSNQCFETPVPTPTPTATATATATIGGPDGSTCADDGQCASGNCVNQVCCNEPCDGPGQFCQTDGVCATRPAAGVPATSRAALIAILAILLAIGAGGLLARTRRQ